MVPDNLQNQSPAPAPQPAGPVPLQNAPGAPAGTRLSPSQQASAEARQLMARYQHDPYQLSESLQQLKSAYLAEYFHINPNAAGN